MPAKKGAPDGIRVSGVLPGGVETPIWTQAPFFQELVTRVGSERAAFDQMAAMATPLGRYPSADEIAGLIAFLLSDASATMTGALWSATAGIHSSVPRLAPGSKRDFEPQRAQRAQRGEKRIEILSLSLSLSSSVPSVPSVVQFFFIAVWGEVGSRRIHPA
ncbi:SDR family oxidoreductase [Sorangium sp. So ce1024]|uniref:SDR family oxidoreductase n=1 Tax=unclassified Sorangium TaxID=2621164 RepID=UPI003EFC786C